MLGGYLRTVFGMTEREKDINGGLADAKVTREAAAYEEERADRWFRGWLRRTGQDVPTESTESVER